ncbi:hypothetical protein METBIDRAFT_33664 [Metschnikowia bicuspidata var. bicuspidata NRRL YB-4993]|uniref:Peptide:N-glycanase 1 n=1 Tax=Metschnikowia bicuspidata var. bicuspidata NRRL YB-4993 TaxID=869754 RepID=A0A1A0H4T3_9ASCO|nr:hypothetical protein METBIDRAFT_33664 [Metschnikowia bicuspidata var. bicuspidata NRRL YB-4993]OBA19046.1 hypothetical protein METBIDRAFT_33664 [Metschnikowia bicuspidata var. bicuspidata NRRL YB-4993]
MGVCLDYKHLANLLLISYTKGMLDLAKTKGSRRIYVKSQADSRIIRSIQRISHDLKHYDISESLEKALDLIDLDKIYAGVYQREMSSVNTALGYEDLVVLETLRYFKADFFSWVNRPACPKCKKDGDNIQPKGSEAPPEINPDEISVIEVYTCIDCNQRVEFPRINNPARLLETRRGRCGEWVNCFMLILKAILGPEVPTRYIWNAEDHVWCEYYSHKMKRWVHLDPCEDVFDEPSLYSRNWGKKMSWVLGISHDYVVDLSGKYVTERGKTIPKNTVANEQAIARFLESYNALLLSQNWDALQLLDASVDEKYLKLYYETLLPQAKERNDSKVAHSESENLPQGRQTGDALWTAARGENG